MANISNCCVCMMIKFICNASSHFVPNLMDIVTNIHNSHHKMNKILYELKKCRLIGYDESYSKLWISKFLYCFLYFHMCLHISYEQIHMSYPEFLPVVHVYIWYCNYTIHCFHVVFFIVHIFTCARNQHRFLFHQVWKIGNMRGLFTMCFHILSNWK